MPRRMPRRSLDHDPTVAKHVVLTIDQAQLDLAAGPLGKLDDVAMRDVVKAIGHVIESDCEPI